MDFQKIKTDYQSGVSISELARRYSVSAARIRYRARKENWLVFDGKSSLKDAAFSTARVLLGVSGRYEEILKDGGKLDSRDLKYLTAAEKELLEVLGSLDCSEETSASRGDDILISSADSSGLIFIPSVISEEA